MPKSASSFVFQMTRSAFESQEKMGRAKLRRIDEFIPVAIDTYFAEDAIQNGLNLENPWEAEKRVAHLDRLFDHLIEKVDDRRDEAIVIKTHLPCSPKIADAIKRGAVLASATFRHPAEMILSRQDHAKRDDEILQYDILSSYLTFVREFYTWANLPQVRRYYYDEIVLRPNAVVGDICRHVGVQEDLSRLLDEYLANKKGKILEFNKGVLNRAADEMSSEEFRKIEEYFSDFIEFIRCHKQSDLMATRKPQGNL